MAICDWIKGKCSKSHIKSYKIIVENLAGWMSEVVSGILTFGGWWGMEMLENKMEVGHK